MPLELSIAIIGLIMGSITAVSGGSGAFAVPAMLALGIPPITALALNQVSDIGAIPGALLRYAKKKVSWKSVLPTAIPLAMGGYLGARIVLALPETTLRTIIIIGVTVALFLTFKSPQHKEDQATEKHSMLAYIILFFCGIWGGMLGMATGIMVTITLIYLLKLKFLEAHATMLASTLPRILIVSTTLITNAGIPWKLAGIMIASNLIGSFIVSSFAIKNNGNTIVRKAMMCISITLLIFVTVQTLL